MLFSTFSAVFLGLASIASTSPLAYNALAAREASAVERGLIWAPRQLQTRSRKNQNKKNIILRQDINIQLTQIQIIQEVQIVNVIQNIIIVVGLNDARDNVRKNHYRNKNQNNNVNTVIIVITVVIDNRNQNNRNVRYLTRQVESNPEAATKEWVVVTEQSTMTIDSQNPTGTGAAEATEAFATGAVAPQVAAYDPSAPLELSEDALLPANIEAPSWSQASKEEDPAIIIEANQAVFIVFNNQNGNDKNNKGGKKGKKD